MLKKIIRKKPLPIEEPESSNMLKRKLTVFDLCLYGIGSMCGGYIYGVSVVLLATKSGACSFVSNIIAGMIAYLNAQCYAELSSRWPFGGGGYSFTYMICGELLAFITGWAMLLEYLLGFAFASIGAANAIDVLSNHTINNAFKYYIGEFPDTGGYLTDTPNILAAIIALVIVFMLGMGAKISLALNAAITAISTIILVICAGYMAGNSHTLDFVTRIPVNQTVTQGRSTIIPFGMVGIFSGAALTFNAFSGFDALALTGDAVVEPKRTIPLATNISMLIVFVISTFYYTCLSFYQPWFLVNSKLGLSGIFMQQNVVSMKILAGVGEIAGYLTSGFCNMFALSHIAYALSNDGLILPLFHYVSDMFQVPIFTNVIFGVLAAVMALLFDMNIIANFMSGGILISYTIVTIDVLIIRLIDVDKKELAISPDEDGLTFSLKEITFKRKIEDNCPTMSRFSKPVLLILAILCLICFCFFTNVISISSITIPLKASLITISAIILIGSVVTLFTFQYYFPENGFRVKPIPYIPILLILLNTFLASNLQFNVWYRLGIWMLLGLINYFAYGIFHSKSNLDLDPLNDDEEKCLIGTRDLETLALKTK